MLREPLFDLTGLAGAGAEAAASHKAPGSLAREDDSWGWKDLRRISARLET